MARASVLALALALGVGGQAPVQAQSQTPAQSAAFPADVAPKVAALSPDKQAFLRDAARLAMFNLTTEKLADAFRARSAGEVDAYVASLMKVVADSAYKPGVDAGAVALNPKATAFNASMTLKPAMFDEFRRDPGPISLDHYMYQQGGFATFAHAPVAMRKEDLVAGKVEVAFMGVAADFSSGWRDGKHGPLALRMSDGLVGDSVYVGVNPSTVLRMADYGDIAIDPMSLERTIGHVRMMVGEAARTGAAPFVVGGDHSLMLANVGAMADVHGKGGFSVVQFDAHYEAEAGGDHFVSDNQAVHRLVAGGLLDPAKLVQVGVRGGEMTGAELAGLRAKGVRVHTMADVEKDGWQAIAAKVVEQVKAGPLKVFVSFDMSVLDPAYAAGAGRPVPNGLTMREAVPLVRTICAEANVIGFELLDPAPVLDVSYRTAQNANYILHSCLAGMAKRKVSIPR